MARREHRVADVAGAHALSSHCQFGCPITRVRELSNLVEIQGAREGVDTPFDPVDHLAEHMADIAGADSGKARGMEGLEGIGRVGLRYPIPPYGAQMDPAFGMAVSYPGGGKGKKAAGTGV